MEIKYIWIIISIGFISQSTHSPLLLQNILEWRNSDSETIYHLKCGYDTDWINFLHSSSYRTQVYWISSAYIDVLKAKFSWNNLIDTKIFINIFSPSFILVNCWELLKLHRLLCPTDLGFTEATENVPFVFKWLNFFSLGLRRYSAFNNFQF